MNADIPWRTLRGDAKGAVTGAFRYKAFISYSWADRAQGEWLHHALETYRAPKSLGGARLHPVFKDREEEAAGHSIGEAIERALGASEFLIVLCSPRSAQSKWVNREVAWFKAHRDPKKILAVVVDGEPMASAVPGREAEECFPRTLLMKVGADLQPTEEFEDAPLAADSRETGDGRRGAKLKIAAAMLGVGLDDLVKRDDRRRQQRRRLVMSGMAAGMALLGGLAIFAFVQRDAAVAAQLRAEAAEKDAKFQAAEAQDLVEFMLTDFRQELDSLGRLDVLERTGKRLLESFAKQDVQKLDANALGRRARVLLLLGEVDNTRGRLDAALSRYKEASATTEELLRRNPENAQQIFDHAQSVFWVGYIAWQRGDHALAKKQFTEYYDLAQRLVAIDPDKDEWRMEVGYAVNNLGILAMDQGEAAEAEGSFRDYLAITTHLAKENPDNVQWVIERGQAYAWLADSLHRQAKLEDALEARRAEMALYDRSVVVFTDNIALIRFMSIGHYRLAQIEISGGRLESALTHAIEASHLADRLLAIEPQNTDQIARTSSAYSVLGEAYILLHRYSDARFSLSKSIAFAEQLVAHDGDVTEWRGTTLATPKLMIARAGVKEAKLQEAKTIFNEVALDLGAMIASELSNPIIVRNYCAALAGRARLDAAFDRDWAEIIELLASDASRLGPDSLALLAEAYERTGKSEKAAAIASKLHGGGYRHPDFVSLMVDVPQLARAEAASAQ